ncbi:MarR family winged helix-turn-helix transcriptional regulator [Pseudomonas sp. UBA4194]|jgi:DNA-binding MarR family transcriptional regulator|uniref:MarR family winged helix-turn-helix transcriptional regulator n=1 Tax=Pseudomonas sp. UBA4194 TaxID=1947317 RepID=UPI0025DA9CB5|nr:MarR family transcriptional regulator [Pseudomonas sp. UBA4194]
MNHYTPDTFYTCNLGLLLGRGSALKDRILDAHLVPYGVTAAQFKVLIINARFGVDTPAEMSRYLALDSGSMTRMLDRLEQKQLIVRRRSEADRRQVQLVLTEEGETLAARLPVIGANAMNELVGMLEPQEITELERILTKILMASGDSLMALGAGAK